MLSKRETECLSWFANGKTAWETAQILDISESTVIFHIENAKKKLGATNITHAVAISVTKGWVAVDLTKDSELDE